MTFRDLKEDDLEWFVTVRNSCRSWLHDSRRFNADDARTWFPSAKQSFWVIALDDAKIGYLRFSPATRGDDLIQVGVDLDPKYHGEGFGYRSYALALPLLKERFGGDGFSLFVLRDNLRALSLYRKLGFVTDFVRLAFVGQFPWAGRSNYDRIYDLHMVRRPGISVDPHADLADELVLSASN